ncbi:MAG: putative Ig domain-containing protein, partial [Verrucomicrobiota bacterium]
AGTQSLGVIFSPTDVSNYEASSASATVVVAKAPATVVIGGSLSVDYDYLPHPVVVTVTPGSLAVVVTYNGSIEAPFHAGTYAVVATIKDANYQGSVSSTLTIGPEIPPAITQQPVGGVFNPGSPVSILSVQGTGSPTLSYQWKRDGSNLAPGGTGATLDLGLMNAAVAGTYTVSITNSVGSVTSAPANIVLGVSPTIDIAPQSQTVVNGGSIILSVSGSGVPAPAFQWNRDGRMISGATLSTLALPNLTATGTYAYSVVLLNQVGSLESAAAMVRVLEPVPVYTGSLALKATVGKPFSYTLSAVNGPKGFSATGLPAGLSLGTLTGVVSGTPAALGVSNVGLVMTNGGGSSPVYNISLEVLPQIPVNSNAQLSATARSGQAFNYQITATNLPTSYVADGLPNGLVVNPTTGLISGTLGSIPSAQTQLVTLKAANAGGESVGTTLSLTLLPAVPVINRPSDNPTLSYTVISGGSFAFQITASGAPTSYSATPLPAGLSLGANGAITGTVTASGIYKITIGATNEGGQGTAVLTLQVGSPAPVITSPVSAIAQVGVPFEYFITADGNPTVYTGSSNVSWLTFNAPNKLSGTPTTTTSAQVQLSAANAGGAVGNATLYVSVLPAKPVITGSLSVQAVAGDAFSYQIVASGAPTGYTAQNLPLGLRLDAAQGLITGAVANAGTSTVTLGAVNAGGESNAALTLVAKPSRPVITSRTAVTGTVGVSFSYPITATGNPTSFGKESGPGWLTINGGTLSGTPPSVGFSKFVVTASNESGQGAVSVGLTVQLPPPTIVSGSLATVVLGDPFSFQVKAGNDPTSFSATNRPIWLEFDTTTGVLQGVPTASGTYTIGVGATNDSGTGTGTLTLVVGPRRPVITSSLAVGGQAGRAFSYQIVADGSPTAYLVDSAQLTALGTGLSFGSLTGVISGSLGAITPGATAETKQLKVGATNASGTTQVTVFVKVERAIDVLPSFAQNSTAVAGKPATIPFSSSVVSTGSFSPVWSFVDSTSVPAWLRLDSGSLSVLAPLSAIGSGSSTTVPVALTGVDEANARIVSGTVSLTISKPSVPPTVSIVSSPASPVSKDQRVTLTLSGVPADYDGTFQWRRNGVTLPRDVASGGSYAFNVSSADDIGTYSVVLTNSVGSTPSNPLVVASDANPLRVDQELVSKVVLAGSTLVWNDFVAGSGSLQTGSLTYAWTRGTDNLASAGSILSIGSVAVADAGFYTVTASNGLYSASSTGELRVFNPISVPQLTLEQGTLSSALSAGTVTLNAGQTVSFVANATGGDPASATGKLRYQWYKASIANGAGEPILGATASRFVLDVNTGLSGAQYWAKVSVSDPFASGGTTTFAARDSGKVALQVRNPAMITVQPSASLAKVAVGGSVSLSVQATGTDLVYQWYKDGNALSGGSASYSFTATETSGGSYTVKVSNVVNSVLSAPVGVAVRIPVAITQSPDSRTVNPQSAAKLRVTAKGSGVLSYQWQKDGVALSNGTSDSGMILSGVTTDQLGLENIGVADEGGYNVVVSQLEDAVSTSATSSTATLTVDNSIKITTNPADRTVLVGGTATFSVVAVGKTLKYQWRRNGVTLADGTDSTGTTYAGTTSAALTVRAVAAGGDYDVLISSGALSVASQAAHLEAVEPLRFVTILVNATALVPSQGQTTVSYPLTPVLAGGGTYQFKWYKNAETGVISTAPSYTVVATGTSASDTYKVTVSSSVTLAGGSILSLAPVTSSAVSVGLMAPVSIDTAPEAVAADLGGSVTLSVVASGGGTLAYQWEKLGADGISTLNLSGATSSVYTVSDLAPSDAGSYRVKISNGRGAVYSKYVTLTVRQKDFILKQPSALTVNPSDSASFGVTASGSNLWTLSYKWRKGGTDLVDNGTISGSASAKLTVNSVSVSDDGALYDVVVTGTYGALTSAFTSASARLSVNRPVTIQTQPKAPLLRAGGTATLFVNVSGTPEFTYQWRKDGVAVGTLSSAISGGTSAVLTLNAPSSGAAALSGIYDVVVSNAVGSVTSDAVSLSLLEPVKIIDDPASVSVEPYSGVQLSVSATGSAPRTYQWFKNGVAVGTSSSTVSGGTTDTLF